MPSRLGHGLYKKIDCLKNIFRCIIIYIIIIIIIMGIREKRVELSLTIIQEHTVEQVQ